MGARTWAGLLAILALAGCGLFGGSGTAPSSAPVARAKPDAAEHADARFLVSYGGALFRVDVRYVALIDESVIAVREGAGEARGQAWPELTVAPSGDFLPGTNFADSSYEQVAVDIAREVQMQDGICSGEEVMSVSLNEDGEVRTLYRSNRRVWVVFALCPEQIKG